MKLSKRVILAVFVIIQLLVNVSFADTGTTITTTSNITTGENSREYEITYTVNVEYEQTQIVPGVVLCLDRSNSMLFLDSDDKPIVDSVRSAVESFITDYYNKFPNGELAIVSFGSNANAHDNYKYYDNAEDALDEVDYVYDYSVDTYYYWRWVWDSFFSGHYEKVYYYDYEWDHWNRNQGATNIGEAFEYCAKTVGKKNKKSNTNNDVIILFTDGVATAYKKGKGNGSTNSYPNEHNKSTIYAYTEGQNAQEVADVITVGYFEAYHGATLNVARETLKWSQNAGFFEASETDDINDIFDEISEQIDFIGTGTTLTDVIKPEFEVVESTISPNDYTLTTNDNGETVLTWNVGNLEPGEYTFSYTALVKEDSFPTGKVDAPVNESVVFRYDDLEDQEQSYDLTINTIDIPPLEDIPIVQSSINQTNLVHGGYLVGDTVSLEHDLSYENVDPYDFTSIDVGTFSKVIGDGVLSDAFELVDSVGWQMNDNSLEYSINDGQSVDDPSNLSWSQTIPLSMKCLQEGEFTFNHNVDYSLTNQFGVAFNYDLQNMSEDTIPVRKGILEFQFNNTLGDPIESASIIINDQVYTQAQSDATGKLLVENLPTGTYTIEIPVPSGYEIPDHYTLNAEDRIEFTVSLNYTNYYEGYGYRFDPLTIKDIAITTVDDLDTIYIADSTSTIDAKVMFTTLNEFETLKLHLVDDYATEDISFALDHVEDASGNEISGFTSDADEIIYDGSTTTLPTGSYTAYIDLTSPSNLGSTSDMDYITEVDQVTTQEPSKSIATSAVTSDDLTVILDNTGPVISLTPDTHDLADVVHVAVNITSQGAPIVEYKCLKGDKEISDFVGVTHEDGLKNISDTDHLVDATFSTYATLPDGAANGDFESIGYYTVYAKDELGNETIEKVFIGNLLNALPDLL